VEVMERRMRIGVSLSVQGARIHALDW